MIEQGGTSGNDSDLYLGGAWDMVILTEIFLGFPLPCAGIML
jgi:hypothetical protein